MLNEKDLKIGMRILWKNNNFSHLDEIISKTNKRLHRKVIKKIGKNALPENTLKNDDIFLMLDQLSARDGWKILFGQETE